MKKMLTVVLITMLVLSSSIVSMAKVALPSDVTGTKYEIAVSALMNAGIVSGYPDGDFMPSQSMNRAEACKLIVTAVGANIDNVGTQFKDLAGYSWATPYIVYAASNGIVSGYDDGTFRPGNKVTMDEIITMSVRALGYKDSSLNANWPLAYLSKAKDLNILSGIDSALKNVDRGTAALLLYNTFLLKGEITNDLGVVISKTLTTDPKPNSITIIKKEGLISTYDVPKINTVFDDLNPGDIIGFSSDVTEKITALVKKDAIYAYNKNFIDSSSYNGISLDSDAPIFTFGLKGDFIQSKVAFTSASSDYGISSFRLMRNISTSAYYIMENDKITAMIVPTDVGFTGKAYGMILETASASNINGKAVGAIQFLLGTNEIQILTDGIVVLPAKVDFLSGSVYEVSLKNGVATNIAEAGLDAIPANKNSAFLELTSDFRRITDTGTDYIIVDRGSGDSEAIELSANAVVYVATYDGNIIESYKAGTRSDLRNGYNVRAFDVTDDGVKSADVLVVSKIVSR